VDLRRRVVPDQYDAQPGRTSHLRREGGHRGRHLRANRRSYRNAVKQSCRHVLQPPCSAAWAIRAGRGPQAAAAADNRFGFGIECHAQIAALTADDDQTRRLAPDAATALVCAASALRLYPYEK